MYTQFHLVQNLSCGQSCGTQQPHQLGNVCTCLKPCCHSEWPYETNSFHINYVQLRDNNKILPLTDIKLMIQILILSNGHSRHF